MPIIIIKGIFKGIGYSFYLGWKVAKLELIILIILQILSGLSPLALLWITQSLINNVVQLITENNNLYSVIGLFILQISIVYCLYIFQNLNSILDKKIKNQMGIEVNQTIFKKTDKLPFIFFEDPETQNFLQRISSSQSQMLNTIFESTSLVKNFLSLASVFIFLFSKHWIFPVILIAGILPLFYIEMLFGKRRFELIKFLTPTGRLESYISDLLTKRDSIKEVKLFSLSDFLIDKWKFNYNSYVQKELKLVINKSKINLVAEFILVVTYAISGIIVVFFISSGKFMVGSFVAILQAVQSIQDSMSAVTRNISTLYESSLYIKDYKAFLRLEERHAQLNYKCETIENMKVQNLTFTYPGFDLPAIKNVSFEISKGKKVAIVGANGSGKTTLIKCLAGLFNPGDGSIFINGKDINEIEIDSYQEKISVLFQDYQKYNFSVLENVGFGQTKRISNIDKIVEATSMAGIHETIEGFKDKYNTRLGRLFEGGTDLSGGQWQKIALSRCFIRESDLIILDEPTSSIDPISEYNIIQNLMSKSNEQSLIFVTHRLGFTHLVDEIIVLANGLVIEKGSHLELLQRKGEYFKLYSTEIDQKEGALT